MKPFRSCLATAILTLFAVGPLPADDLVIADKGKSEAVVVVSPKAGLWEMTAASNLVHYVGLMSGAKPALSNTAESNSAALKSKSPLLIIGQEALKAEPVLQKALDKVAKKNPVLHADAIVVKRDGNRVYMAGTDDDCHYFAMVHLLNQWGCNWYLPSDFGECIPDNPTLKIDKLDFAYAPPFEVRTYWIAWNGEQGGRDEFKRRNFMAQHSVGGGHVLGTYTKDLIPEGKSMFNVPIAEDKTAEHVAKQVAPMFAKGESFSLGMEDGGYDSNSPVDKQLLGGIRDKYFLNETQTDAFMVFYNKVAKILLKQHPDSKAKIGFLAYSNITLPPQRKIVAEKPFVMSLAPIDIDPIHGMDDPRSPPKQEYRDMMYRWSEVMQGRMFIYDYDQSMLVWRDVPNPIIQFIQQDIKHYQKAGILGIDSESRNAIATVFINLWLRGQLLWNPDADLKAMMTAFYPNFYGPAAKPMEAYWNAINKAWADTIATEHEYFVIPAIYTPELVKQLKGNIEEAEKLVAPLKDKKDASRNEKLYVERMKFMRLCFDVLDGYTAMARAAAAECDYKTAVAAGEKGAVARLQLANMNTTFTTRIINDAAETKANGPAWWLGEVEQYRDLGAFTDGTKGKLIVKTPLEWAFRRDPHDTGVARGWAYKPVDLAWWNAEKDRTSVESRKNNPGNWEMVRTDLYLQVQGVLHSDYQSYTGYGWYNTEVEIPAAKASGKVHILFPGLFNECWLYVNGSLVDHRPFPGLWWISDYKFEWDVDLTGHVKPGKNSITVRINNPHHFGGMFRRPFLYEAK